MERELCETLKEKTDYLIIQFERAIIIYFAEKGKKKRTKRD
jgi:hypothetical protein